MKRLPHGIALEKYLAGTNKKGKKGMILSTSQGLMDRKTLSIGPSQVLIISPSQVPGNL